MTTAFGLIGLTALTLIGLIVCADALFPRPTRITTYRSSAKVLPFERREPR